MRHKEDKKLLFSHLLIVLVTISDTFRDLFVERWKLWKSMPLLHETILFHVPGDPFLWLLCELLEMLIMTTIFINFVSIFYRKWFPRGTRMHIFSQKKLMKIWWKFDEKMVHFGRSCPKYASTITRTKPRARSTLFN